jgi:glycosyltransferase involved in cell wall biosynthesis
MFFSVVVPTFNRARFIERCLGSVLTQDFPDFEVIVVDDGSSDGTDLRLQALAHPALRVIRHDTNRGVGPARNSGIAAARSDWIVPLDSDDELVPGALARMHSLAAAAPDDLNALWFRCRMDDGRLCPDPMPTRRDWDYEGFLHFLEETRGRWRDMLRCVRRSCLAEVRYPANRMLEDKFHLDFARRFRSRAEPDVLRLYHQDADDRLVDRLRRLDPLRDSAFIGDRADGFRDLLAEHGRAIANAAPGLYGDYLQLAASSAILAGRRYAGLTHAAALIGRAPLRARPWMLLAASVVGGALAVRLRALAGQARRS